VLIKEYLKYIKDNPEGYWFRARWFGWGWVPAKWQGWAVIFIYVGIAGIIAKKADSNSYSASDTFYRVAIPFVVLTILLIATCYIKGEKPHWSWGIPKKEK
jgi:uncharacterized membrane protein